MLRRRNKALPALNTVYWLTGTKDREKRENIRFEAEALYQWIKMRLFMLKKIMFSVVLH